MWATVILWILAFVLIMAFVGCTAERQTTQEWIPITDEEVGMYQGTATIVCDNIEWESPRKFNCYIIQEVGR
jgi:hypothetical protein